MVKTIRKTSKKRYIAILCVMLLSCFAISGLVLADNGDPAPGIDVQFDSVSIANGDETPSEADGTIFGSVDITVGAVDRTYTIKNTGTGILNITNIRDYRIPDSGIPQDDSPHFTFPSMPSTFIDEGQSTTFTIRFAPNSTGHKDALIEIT